jgi:hypothetical protein
MLTPVGLASVVGENHDFVALAREFGVDVLGFVGA